MEQAQREKEAFGNLYLKYFGRVQGYLAKRLGQSRELAQDLAQETFMRAFKALPAFRSRGYSYLTYLLRISRNLLINFYRKPREERLSEFAKEIQGSDNTEQEMDEKILQEILWKTAKKLPPQNHLVLKLYYQEDLSLREIAKRLRKSENASKLLLSRSRKRLLKILQAETPFLNPGVNTSRKGRGK